MATVQIIDSYKDQTFCGNSVLPGAGTLPVSSWMVHSTLLLIRIIKEPPS